MNAQSKFKCPYFVILCVEPPKRQPQENEKTDPGTKSEGEEDSQTGSVVPKGKATLGRTPNHLTLR